MNEFISRKSRAAVILDAHSRARDEAPLSPFMIHVWHLNRPDSRASLDNADDRARFLFWFYDTFHRLRAPYRSPTPESTLAWLNEPALHVSMKMEDGRNCYLTRFMRHVRPHYKRDIDTQLPDDYLRFLAWFAFDCVPAWNLPPEFVPQELVDVLNRPIILDAPLTTGMYFLGNSRYPELYRTILKESPEVVQAASFELLTELLRAGDARLIPEFVDGFWAKSLNSAGAGLNAYEYVAVNAFATDIEKNAAGHFLGQRFLSRIPQSRSFITVRPSAAPGDPAEPVELTPPRRAFFVYRDTKTIAGLSKAGARSSEALSLAGVDFIDIDFSFGRDRMEEEHASNHSKLCQYDSAVHIFNLNPEYVPECIASHYPLFDGNHYTIGQFYWELSNISHIHECALSIVDEIWVASNYLKSIYQQHVEAPICVMGQVIEPPATNPRFDRAWFDLRDDFRLFLFSFDCGSVVERKNPLGTVRAFQRAFPVGSEKVSLVLKTRNTQNMSTQADRAHWDAVLDATAADERIRILDRTMSSEELASLSDVCDCYVSLHRSEGFGFGPAEAMSLGKPVIATAYSGVSDFCNENTALPVNYRLERVPAGAYPYMSVDREYYWAEPDLEHAAHHMRRLYENPREGAVIGEAGRRFVLNEYSLQELSRRYTERLRHLGFL